MRLKHAAVALAAAGVLSTQAYASEAQINVAAQPVAAFSENDMQTLFETSGRPMQLAALSQQEMKETEGAWLWMAYYYAPQLSALAWTGYRAAPTFGNTWNTWYPRVTNWWNSW